MKCTDTICTRESNGVLSQYHWITQIVIHSHFPIAPESQACDDADGISGTVGEDMMQLLSRRWLGVSCWVYLMSLALAGLMYWLLPGSSALQRWSFDGEIKIRGFTDDLDSMVVRHESNDGTYYYLLNLQTGGATCLKLARLPDYHDLDAFKTKESFLDLDKSKDATSKTIER